MTMPPADILRDALLELGLGPQETVAKTLQAWRHSRLTCHDVCLLLQSFAWQSPTLCRFYGFPGPACIGDQEAEQLTPEDMAALMPAWSAAHDDFQQNSAAATCRRHPIRSGYAHGLERDPGQVSGTWLEGSSLVHPLAALSKGAALERDFCGMRLEET